MKKLRNKNLTVFISCLVLLVNLNGAYFGYYLPFELANKHLKEISTPDQKKEITESVPNVEKENDSEAKTADQLSETTEKKIDTPEDISDEPKKREEKNVSTSNDYSSVDRPSVDEILTTDKIKTTESIEIDSVGLNLNIIQGTNKKNMLYGATTMIDGQKMGEGNYALAGHHMPRNDLLFSPLMNIKKGATIVLKNSEKEFKYKVISTKIVDYRDGSSILKQSEKPVLTLVTCDKPTTTTGRFIVIAELVT